MIGWNQTINITRNSFRLNKFEKNQEKNLRNFKSVKKKTMNQPEQFSNYSFNYYNYPAAGINNISSVTTSPYEYSTYQQASPTSQTYNWPAYQYNYSNYADYNNYQSAYYNQYKNASLSSSNQSFNSSSFDYNSNHSNESSLYNTTPSVQSYTTTETTKCTPSTNVSPVSDYTKPASRKCFESTPVVNNQTPKARNASKIATRHYQLPDRAVEIMNEWFLEHLNNPYPQQSEKEHLAKLGGISIKQVTAWFSNRRNRSQNTKPKRMKRVLEQEINNIFSEFVSDQVSKDVIIEKLRSTLGDHEANSTH